MKKIYNGDVEITGKNYPDWEEKLKYITKITGSVCVYGSAKVDFPVLAEVGGVL